MVDAGDKRSTECSGKFDADDKGKVQLSTGFFF